MVQYLCDCFCLCIVFFLLNLFLFQFRVGHDEISSIGLCDWALRYKRVWNSLVWSQWTPHSQIVIIQSYQLCDQPLWNFTAENYTDEDFGNLTIKLLCWSFFLLSEKTHQETNASLKRESSVHLLLWIDQNRTGKKKKHRQNDLFRKYYRHFDNVHSFSYNSNNQSRR